MTENTNTETRPATNSRMKAVDHTHPDTGRPFGERVVYQRGPTVAADGGERAEGARTSSGERGVADRREATGRTATEGSREQSESDGGERERSEREPRRSGGRSDGGAREAENENEADAEAEGTDENRMKDVDHEPPNEAEANRVFERGNEGRDETR